MISELKKLLKDEPGLKGKAIARKLNAEKKNVNSYLYANPEEFVCDDDFRWWLKSSDELRIEFESHSWVDAESFEHSLLQVESPLDSEIKNVVFVITKDCKVLLEPACRMFALCNQLAESGKNVTVDFTACGKARSFFDRLGFFDSLNPKCVTLPARPKNSRAKRFKGQSENLVEFGLIDVAQSTEEDLNASDKTLVNQLITSFIQLVDKNYEGVATAIFSELIGNIKRHSQTHLKGVASLQKYSGRKNHIQTIVSDSGLGIAATLKTSLATHYPNLFARSGEDDYDMILVEEVLTSGQISRYGKGHGCGFGITTQKAMSFNATLSVRQDTFSMKFFYKNNELINIVRQKNLARIHGTHLCFDFDID